MDVKVLTQIEAVDKNAWSEFVRKHPHGNIFQTPEMYQVYLQTKGYKPVALFAVDGYGKISAVLLAVIQTQYGGVLESISARSIIWGGPLVKNDDIAILKSILKKYDLIVGKKVIYSQFRNLYDMTRFKSTFAELGYHYEEHLNILVDLKKSEALLWKEMHPKRRNEVRKALKEGLIAKEVTSVSKIPQVYEILCEVYKNASLPLADISLFKSAFEILYPKNMFKIFGAFYKEKLIGIICILAYCNVLYDWYAGSLQKYLCKHPNDLLPWEVFKWGKEHGYTLFDFGGAGKPDKPYGVREFKKKFGGYMVNYGRFEKVHSKVKFQIARIGLKLWQVLNRL